MGLFLLLRKRLRRPERVTPVTRVPWSIRSRASPCMINNPPHQSTKRARNITTSHTHNFIKYEQGINNSLNRNKANQHSSTSPSYYKYFLILEEDVYSIVGEEQPQNIKKSILITLEAEEEEMLDDSDVLGMLPCSGDGRIVKKQRWMKLDGFPREEG